MNESDKIDAKGGLRVLFVSSEAQPFATVGGLGAVMEVLPKSLRDLGQDVRMLIPRYAQIGTEKWGLQMEYEGLRVPTGNQKGPREFLCNVKRYNPNDDKNAPVITYFLENMEYYEQRANVYGYADDAARWMLLCRGTLEFLKVADWVPDVIVVTDWHTGLLPNLQKTYYQDDPRISKIAVVHSIHNLGSQMSGTGHRFIPPEEADDGYSLLPAFEDKKLPKINGMKRAIIYADMINTVSQTYAKEITTPAYGEGLEEILSKKQEQGRLVGILNGLDYTLWSPGTDSLLKHKFSLKNFAPRAKNKAALQKLFDLSVSDKTFVIGIVARMTSQKGIDLLEPVIGSLLHDLPIQITAVGEGESQIMEFILNLKKIFPDRVGAEFSYQADLAHHIYAGADVILVPSRFEPSGLTQMEAMAYGCIPIVRKTGGLADTVEDFDPGTDRGTGFVFEKIDSLSLMIAIVRAYQSWLYKDSWRQLQIRAMEKDFSWQNSARQYVELFKKAIQIRKASQN